MLQGVGEGGENRKSSAHLLEDSENKESGMYVQATAHMERSKGTQELVLTTTWVHLDCQACMAGVFIH